MSKEPIVAYKVIKVGWRYYVVPSCFSDEYLEYIATELHKIFYWSILKKNAEKVCKRFNNAYNRGYFEGYMECKWVESINKKEG